MLWVVTAIVAVVADPSTRAQLQWLTSPGGPWASLGWELVAPRALA
jgi:hypothetical protein